MGYDGEDWKDGDPWMGVILLGLIVVPIFFLFL